MHISQERSMKCIFQLLLINILFLPTLNVYSATPANQLIDAIISGEHNELRSLIAQGIDINSKNQAGRTALMVGTFYGNKVMVKSLLASGADVNLKDNNNRTALIDAAAFGFDEIVRLLMTMGADLNAKTKSGKTALTGAIAGDYQVIVKMLIERKVDVNLADNLGNKPLDIAKRMKRKKISKLLKKAGAEESAE
jgi:ankyrin repeat protein